MAIVKGTRHIGGTGLPRDRDYEAEPYENHPRRLGDSYKATQPIDDEDYYYNNQLGAPSTNETS